MARTKFNRITIEYGGVDLLAGGWFADADGALNGSTQYTTSAVQSVGADAVALDENGNVERAREISIAVDYDSEADMLADVIAREGFADAHQRAVLRVCARERAQARGWLQLAAGFGEWKINGETFTCPDDYTSVEDWDTALEPFGLYCTDEAIASGSPKVNIAAIEYGEAGNAITLEATSESAPVSGPTLTGGADEVAQAYDAALSGLDYSSSVAGRGLRVVYRYSFILGGAADA